ncbi:SDR family oxidoreductase [Streptomyces sp. NPDC002533]
MVELTGKAVVAAVHHASERAAVQGAAESVGAAGDAAFAMRAEISSPDGPAELREEFDASIGAYTDADPDSCERMTAVNARAPFFLIQQALGRLRDGSRIINVSSAVTRMTFPGTAVHGLTEGAPNTLTLRLAQNPGGRGITVDAISPGPPGHRRRRGPAARQRPGTGG